MANANFYDKDTINYLLQFNIILLLQRMAFHTLSHFLPCNDYQKCTINNQNFSDTPFGQVPVLEIDGVMYPESLAIARYVANEVNLAGNNKLENLKIDSMVYTIGDFLDSKYMMVEKVYQCNQLPQCK